MRLLRFQQNIVVGRMVTARKLHGSVDLRFTLSEQEGATIRGCRGEGCNGFHRGTSADFAVFESEFFLHRQNIRIFLTIAQGDRQLVGAQVDEGGAEEQTTPHIGLVAVVVGIEIDAVASAEIRQEILSLFGHGQRDEVEAAVGVAFLLFDDLKVGENVAKFLFLGGRQVPKVGHTTARLLSVAESRSQLFAVAESQHSANVGFFERRKAVNRLGDGLGLRFDVLLEKCARKMLFIERFGVQIVENRLETLGGEAEIDVGDAIAQGDGFVEEFLVEIHGDQTTWQRIFRIEQSSVDFPRSEAEILRQNAVVEQQLHIMVFLLKTAKFVGSASLYIEIFT